MQGHNVRILWQFCSAESTREVQEILSKCCCPRQVLMCTTTLPSLQTKSRCNSLTASGNVSHLAWKSFFMLLACQSVPRYILGSGFLYPKPLKPYCAAGFRSQHRQDKTLWGSLHVAVAGFFVGKCLCWFVTSRWKTTICSSGSLSLVVKQMFCLWSLRHLL